VREAGRGAPLALEAGPDVGLRVARLEKLDRDGPLEDLVAAQDHDRHAPRADLALQNESICETDHAQDYMS
jgi:hypothetical protein